MNTKKYYESCLGRKISDRTWARDKARIKAFDLTLSKENLKKFADLKTQSKKFGLPIDQVLNYFFNTTNTPDTLGINIYSAVLKITENKPHPCTIRRWFPQGYQLERKYTSQEVDQIYLHALIYRIRNGKQLCN
ncbi:hypothetical protein VF14_31815 [Nostoc linckia z18]|uniref:Uncharacterized protein n=2 Tax=Nostoc linckia TaxID=92942 RepID=A0A9Q5Z5X8_NOSLI|nr:hypothetical protein [Nostoc linckia]PHK34612.1 hypothetical protein VF12_23565 [Nostoc linckia z15]PHK41175.1 hypothetical protein VF13_31670 [Nostoc linckia z16]PHJ55783.1 hypothetical protein VF02_35430 [Nostoc linckia z1]PHJ56997.1 hypothetical protein VF05_36450 [Nostoc linckia z3]PHJ58291.1 hypothetical protein VF03_35635 [Nostoc linckia z2]